MRRRARLPERPAARGVSASSLTPSSLPSPSAEELEAEAAEEEERASLDSLRRQLADARRRRREAESRRCVWRHAAWHAAWGVLSAAAITDSN